MPSALPKAEKMSWRDAVIAAISDLRRDTFTLQELYGSADHLAGLFPANMNIEAKIRQQLQYLRDEGFIDFVDNRGTYRVRRFVSLPTR